MPTRFPGTDVMSDRNGTGGHPALTDHQTGLPNRLHFDTVFDVVFATGCRGVPLTVILLEMDPFSEWATKTDELEISRVLRSIGNTLAPVIRQSDLLARWDEACFSFCLVDCNLAGAVLVADRIDGLMDSIRQMTGLTFSIGGAAFDLDMEEPGDLMGAAEKALQAARNRGRDQMEFLR